MTSEPGPADERRLHPAATVIHAIHHARGFGFAFIAVIASRGLTTGLVVGAAILLVSATIAIIHWRTTTYAVVDHTLRLRTGVFSRKEQNIPASRISAVDSSRGLLQRIFGVVAVQVQTAGGKKKAELVLRAVGLGEAERLRRELGHRGTAATDAAPEPTSVETSAGDALQGGGHAGATSEADSLAGAPATVAAGASAGAGAGAGQATFTNPQVIDPGAPVVFAMSRRDLVMGALTSPSIAVVGAATAAGYSTLSDLLPHSIQRTLSGAARDLTVTTAIELAVIAVIVATMISVIGTVLLYAGFQITQDERRLRVRRGLITEHVATVPIDRIHGLRIIESPVRQLFGYASIEVEVAGYANEDEATRTLVPFVRHAAIPALVERLVPSLRWPAQNLHPVPRRARRRYLTIPLLVAALPAVAVAASPIGAGRFAAAFFPLVAVAYGRAAARDAGWLLDGDTLTFRRRQLVRSTLLARASRLQQVAARTSPWQRRAALATVLVRLSNARSGRVRHVDREVAGGLLGVISQDRAGLPQIVSEQS